MLTKNSPAITNNIIGLLYETKKCKRKYIKVIIPRPISQADPRIRGFISLIKRYINLKPITSQVKMNEIKKSILNTFRGS